MILAQLIAYLLLTPILDRTMRLHIDLSQALVQVSNFAVKGTRR